MKHVRNKHINVYGDGLYSLIEKDKKLYPFKIATQSIINLSFNNTNEVVEYYQNKYGSEVKFYGFKQGE